MSARTTASALDQLSMFILDVLRHDDVEQLSSILKLLNNDGCVGWRQFWPRDFTSEEVIPSLEGLVRSGYATVLRVGESTDELIPVPFEKLNVRSDQQSLWFALADEGRALWRQWEPPAVSESPCSAGATRSSP